MILFFISRAAAPVRFVFYSLRVCLKLNLILQMELALSWLAMYIFLPVIGAFLGLIFYITIRGGVYQQITKIQQTRPFVFVAISTLAGLFSVQGRIQDSG